MSATYQLLLIEDDEGDAALLQRYLRRSQLSFQCLRVDSRASLQQALSESDWDLVICDYRLPGFDAHDALALVRSIQPELPFIVLSGLIGEEQAVDMMRAGAQDFVMKNRPARLIPAIERELAESLRHREQRMLTNALKAQDERLRLALRVTGDGVWECNPSSGLATFSDSFCQMLGFGPGELAPKLSAWRERIHPEDQSGVAAAEQAHRLGETSLYRSEHRLRRKDDSWIWVLDRGVILERDSSGQPVREVGTLTDISQAKENEQALRDSHSNLQKLAQQVPGALFQLRMYPDGRLSLPYASERFVEMHELNPEAISSDASALFRSVHAEDREEVLQTISSSASQRSNWSCEYRVVQLENGIRWLRSDAQPETLADGSTLWHGFTQDITDRLNAEAELRLLQTCITQVNDPILVTEADPDPKEGHRVVYVNPAFEQRTGFSAEEIVGKTPKILQGKDTDREELARIGSALRKWCPVRSEVLNYTKSGTPFWMELNIAPVSNPRGRFTHWISIQRDISARKTHETEREQLIQQLETSNAQLHTYNHSIAHDLRNPVLAIRGMTDLAKIAVEAGNSDYAKTCMARVIQAANHADALINSLMELARLGRRALRIGKVDLAKAISASLDDLMLQVADARAEVQTEIPTELELHADPVMLRVMLDNLIGNALRHGQSAKPLCITVRVATTDEPKGVLIEVDDNGVGMANELGQRAFRLFERVSAKTAGTGVGLALVEKAAQMHGGRAELLRAELGGGCCFAVWLPRQLETPADLS